MQTIVLAIAQNRAQNINNRILMNWWSYQ